MSLTTSPCTAANFQPLGFGSREREAPLPLPNAVSPSKLSLSNHGLLAWEMFVQMRKCKHVAQSSAPGENSASSAVLTRRPSFTQLVPLLSGVAVMGGALALGPQCSQTDWEALRRPIQETQMTGLASCLSWTARHQESVLLPWTSMTVRAPRVSLAPLLSFPRTSSTISAIWSLLFLRKSWPGHRKKRVVKVDSPPAVPILRAGIQRSEPDLDVSPQTILFLTPYINLKMDLLLIKRGQVPCFIL